MASEQVLAEMSNDISDNTYQLVVESDEMSQSIKKFYKDVYRDDKKIYRESLDHKNLNENGIILEHKNDYIILSLKSNNFDALQGGAIVIDTLVNGASGIRKEYEIQLTKVDSTWVLMNEDQKIVSHFFIETNKVFLLGTVGIKNVIMK